MATENFPICFPFCFNDSEEEVSEEEYNLRFLNEGEKVSILRKPGKRVCIIKRN